MREIALHLMDIAQNSLAAGAGEVFLELEEDRARGLLVVRITDNGCGMRREEAQKALRPFYTTRATRKVGLGLPLFREAAERTGGSLSVFSEPGMGTKVTAQFFLSSIDMIPVGDIDGTVKLLIACNPDVEITFLRKYRTVEGEERSFCLCPQILKSILKDIPCHTPQAAVRIGEWLKEQRAALYENVQ